MNGVYTKYTIYIYIHILFMDIMYYSGTTFTRTTFVFRQAESSDSQSAPGLPEPLSENPCPSPGTGRTPA